MQYRMLETFITFSRFGLDVIRVFFIALLPTSFKKRRDFMLIPVLLFIVGLLCLIKGGDWFVDGATGIARRFHVPELQW